MEESAVENGMECREKGKASKHKHNGKRDRNKNVSVKRNEPLSVIDSGDSLIGNNAVAGSNIGINNGGKSSIKSVARVALYALTAVAAVMLTFMFIVLAITLVKINKAKSSIKEYYNEASKIEQHSTGINLKIDSLTYEELINTINETIGYDENIGDYRESINEAFKSNITYDDFIPVEEFVKAQYKHDFGLNDLKGAEADVLYIYNKVAQYTAYTNAVNQFISAKVAIDDLYSRIAGAEYNSEGQSVMNTSVLELRTVIESVVTNTEIKEELYGSCDKIYRMLNVVYDFVLNVNKNYVDTVSSNVLEMYTGQMDDYYCKVATAMMMATDTQVYAAYKSYFGDSDTEYKMYNMANNIAFNSDEVISIAKIVPFISEDVVNKILDKYTEKTVYNSLKIADSDYDKIFLSESLSAETWAWSYLFGNYIDTENNTLLEVYDYGTDASYLVKFIGGEIKFDTYEEQMAWVVANKVFMIAVDYMCGILESSEMLEYVMDTDMNEISEETSASYDSLLMAYYLVGSNKLSPFMK